MDGVVMVLLVLLRTGATLPAVVAVAVLVEMLVLLLKFLIIPLAVRVVLEEQVQNILLVEVQHTMVVAVVEELSNH